MAPEPSFDPIDAAALLRALEKPDDEPPRSGA